MDIKEIFNDLDETYQTIEYQGNEVEVNLYFDESKDEHKNIEMLIQQLENLENLDRTAREYLVKSIQQDKYFLDQMFSSILEEGATPNTKLGDYQDEYGDDIVSEMSAEEFVSTLRIGGIMLYIDEPETTYTEYNSNELNSAENPSVKDNNIYIILKYIFDGEDNEGLFWEWELLSLFNLKGEYVETYFGKQF